MKSSFIPMRISALLAVLTIITSCQKQLLLQPQTISLNSQDSSTGDFIIKSQNITKTTGGYQFDGTLSAKNNDGLEFEIGDGNFQVETDAANTITSFKGTGIAQFPNVGIFKEIRKSFDWKAIMSNIDYQTGSFYIQTYGIEVPLNPDRKYIHFKVFDENKDGKYQLRNVANSIIYEFVDLYIDPNDPAVFFKAQLWKPGSDKKEATNLVSKFWKNISTKLVSLGKGALEYGLAPSLTIGISNNGTFLSKPYQFTMSDAESFKQNFGYDRFESLPSHLYYKLAGIPIPETGVLELTGESYVHLPINTLIPPVTPGQPIKENYTDVLDWLNNDEKNGYMVSFTGSMDPGDKGIGLVLGMLPNINKIVGKEIFNEDFNIDLVGVTMQYQIPGPNQIGSQQVPSFFRYGGETKLPILSEIFGDGIKKYLITIPSPNVPSFTYFNLGPQLDDISYYVECESKIIVPFYGESDLGRGHFLIDKNGINFGTKLVAPLGPLQLSKELKGKFSPESFELTGIAEGKIVLPNGVELAGVHLATRIASDSGITLHGIAGLPMGLGDATVTGQLNTAGITLNGQLNAGSEIQFDNGFKLPSAGLKFSVSTNPSEGVQLEGNLQIPNIGLVAVKGHINKNDFQLDGTIQTAQVSFGSTTLPTVGASISISKSKGIYFRGSFDLGSALGLASMEGSINSTGINLSGTLSSSIMIAGHSFNIASGKINASNAGVLISGNIDLYIFRVDVAGAIYSKNNFAMDGKSAYNGTIFKSSINVHVTPESVTLNGTGHVYGLLGNEIYSGAMSFEPNWNAHTISACYTLLGVQTCISL